MLPTGPPSKAQELIAKGTVPGLRALVFKSCGFAGLASKVSVLSAVFGSKSGLGLEEMTMEHDLARIIHEQWIMPANFLISCDNMIYGHSDLLLADRLMFETENGKV